MNTENSPTPLPSKSLAPELEEVSAYSVTSRFEHEPVLTDLSSLRGIASVLVVGGTFDPFTRAHLEVPHHVAELLGVQALLYIPVQQNPLKTSGPQAESADRLAMIRNCLREEQHSFVSPLELRRVGNSYTVDTMREIRAAVGETTRLFLFIGSDCVHRLPEWKDLEGLRTLCTIVPVTRGESIENCLATVRGKLSEDFIAELKSRFVDIGVPVISATMARERLVHGELPWDLLPPAVAEYIEQRGLYGYAAH